MTRERMDQLVDRISAWARLLTPAGVIIMLYLTSTFATKEEMKLIQEDIHNIDTSIQLLLEWNKHNKQQDEIIQEMGRKIHSLELKIVALKK